MEKVLRTISYSQLGKNGRLGNCLFQIAATWAYGLRHNRLVQLPDWDYFKYFKFPFQPNNNIKVDHIYREPAFSFNEIPEFEEDHVDLNGYFQSYKYSNDIDLNVLFELKDEYKFMVDSIFNIINPLRFHTCGVHVRRGDYLNPGTNEYHGVLPIEYYKDGANSLYGYEKAPLFLMFSDDIEWCKKEFVNHPNIYFVEGNQDVIDLFLMARCNDNIIANSSFSYWAALLNQNKDKKVVAPNSWFGPTGSHLVTKDLYLPSWQKI